MDPTTNVSILALAAGALCGWWVAVRPGACYRGVGGSVSLLILVTAVLLGMLALGGQHTGGNSPSRSVTQFALLPR